MTELKTGGAQGYLRIATEEAFITPEVLSAYKRLIAAVPLKNVTSRFAMEKIKSTTALPIL